MQTIFNVYWNGNFFYYTVLKISFQIALIAIEIILTFFNDVLQDSLMVRFLFFIITAVLIAMGVTKLADKILPVDKDFVSAEEESGEELHSPNY